MNSTKTQIKEFRGIINNIVTDILSEGTYDDFMGLQDSKTCNAHTIFLEEELKQRFKKVQILEFAQGIYISPNKHVPCDDEKCSVIEKPKYGLKGNLKSKGQICKAIAVYYIRIFNLIGAIMAAIDPENNMCLRRLNALYKPLTDKEGEVKICSRDDEKLYPKNFLKIEGMKELLTLYQMYNVEGLKSQHNAMKEEIVQLQEKIKNSFKGSDSKKVTTLINPDENKNEEENGDEENGEENENNDIELENNLSVNNINDKIRKLEKKKRKKITNKNRTNKGANGNAKEATTGANTKGANTNTGANANTKGANKGANANTKGANKGANGNTTGANGNTTGANKRANGNTTGANGNTTEANGNTTGANANTSPLEDMPPANNPDTPPPPPTAPANNPDMPPAPPTAPANNPDMPPANNPAEVNVSDNSNSNSNSNHMTGGRRTRKNNRNKKTKQKGAKQKGAKQKGAKQKGGGWFGDLIGLGETNTNTNTSGNVPTVEANNENVEEARTELKTLKEFRSFMENIKTPKEILAEGSKISISSYPTDFSSRPECKENGDKKLNINVSYKSEDPNYPFKDYIDNYKLINEHYKESTNIIKDILTNEILAKVNNRYTVQNITSDDLLNIEKKTRDTLLKYYLRCQQLFKNGFTSLKEGVDKTSSRKLNSEI